MQIYKLRSHEFTPRANKMIAILPKFSCPVYDGFELKTVPDHAEGTNDSEASTAAHLAELRQKVEKV
jgi:hypothetical protein